MRRQEFIGQLRNKLNRLPADELQNVIDYYNEIFLDAGEDREEETARNLGNIDDIVRQIYVENNISPDGNAEYFVGDANRNDNRNTNANYNANNFNQSQNQNQGYNNGNQNADNNVYQNKSSGMSAGAKILLFILLFPVWFPIVAVVFSLLFAFFVTIIALGFALAVSGIVLAVVGIVTIFIAPPIGLITAGVGFMIMALCLLISAPVVRWAWRGLVSFCNWISGKMHNLFFKKGAV